ncbi:MAG: GNAT family N-acetyltransferase [Hyphomicrobiaceae bacterium]
MRHPPTIETDRLRLRSFRAADHGPFTTYCADPQMMTFLGGVISPEDAWRRLSTLAGQWMLNGFGPFAVEEKASGSFAGYAGLWFPHGWPARELMWGLVRAFHGRGYATEAARAARDWANGTLGWQTTISLIDPENHASRGVAERLGATADGAMILRGRQVAIYRHPAPVHSETTN